MNGNDGVIVEDDDEEESAKLDSDLRYPVISLAHITNVIGDIRPIKEIIELIAAPNVIGSATRKTSNAAFLNPYTLYYI